LDLAGDARVKCVDDVALLKALVPLLRARLIGIDIRAKVYYTKANGKRRSLFSRREK
jgi:hypothetical protein